MAIRKPYGQQTPQGEWNSKLSDRHFDPTSRWIASAQAPPAEPELWRVVSGGSPPLLAKADGETEAVDKRPESNEGEWRKDAGGSG
jgi:hypothetical protein